MIKLKVFALFLLVACVWSTAAVSQSSVSYTVNDRGARSIVTSGEGSAQTGGFAKVQPAAGQTSPSGFLMFRFSPGGLLVSEATVPETPGIQNGRIYAEVGGSVNTGVAIANPNNTAAQITFYFTDAVGNNFGQGTTTLAANTKIAAFLNEAPFNGGGLIQGTFTFSSSVPIGVIALRGYTNERSQFLMTTLPVADLSVSSSDIVFFPHYADGGGWTTQVVLVNPSDSPISGTVQFFSEGSGAIAGAPVALVVDGQANVSFTYSIPGRSSQRLRTAGLDAAIKIGSVRVTPTGGTLSPSGLSIFTFKSAGVVVTEAGVPVLQPAQAFRMYMEECGSYSGQLQTGVAIANPSPTTPALVNIELTDNEGVTANLATSVTIPPGGHVARFMKQFIGAIPYPFHGVIRISTSSASGISVVGLRGSYNEENNFLITTAMPVNEAEPRSTSTMVFPHFVSGGGYVTEFILYGGSAGPTSSGSLNFYNAGGGAVSLSSAGLTDDSPVGYKLTGGCHSNQAGF